MINLNHKKSFHFIEKILFGLMLLASVSEFSQLNNSDFSAKPILVRGLDQLLSANYPGNGLEDFNFTYLQLKTKHNVILETQNPRQNLLPEIENNFVTI